MVSIVADSLLGMCTLDWFSRADIGFDRQSLKSIKTYVVGQFVFQLVKFDEAMGMMLWFAVCLSIC